MNTGYWNMILTRVPREGGTVAQIAAAADVSTTTARRYLNEMATRKLVTATDDTPRVYAPVSVPVRGAEDITADPATAACIEGRLDRGEVTPHELRDIIAGKHNARSTP